MITRYARLNLKLKDDCATTSAIEKWQKILYDAAVWGETEDAEVFYLDTEKVIGISVPYTDDGLSLLEAGMTLGFCSRIKEENFENIFEYSWHSLHEADGKTIDSTL